jgi:hypothetical protein
MSRGGHGQVHRTVQVMESQQKEHKGGLLKLRNGHSFFASGRRAIQSLLRKMCGEMTTWCANSVVKPACAYFGPVRRKTY